MRETEEVERFWLSFATTLAVFGGKPRAVNLINRTIRAFYRTGYEESESLFSAAIGP